VIEHGQLLAHGITRHGIAHRIRKGKLHPKARGVYAVGTPNVTRFGERMVAVLACGDGAVLSHLSAAVHWGIWKREPGQIHVTVSPTRNPRPEGVKVFRRSLRRGTATKHHGIPVTTVLQTLIDCAPGRSGREVERMINQADALDLLPADVLERQLEGRPEPGARVLRDILARDAFTLTDSELEAMFVPIALRAGLPKPLTQQWVNGHRVDFYWPDLDLIVEVDGLRYHRTPLQQRRDIERTQAHEDSGLTCRRFIYWQVAKDASYVGTALARLRPPARTPGRPRAA
jgi:very-short-patch-repair endonuclease